MTYNIYCKSDLYKNTHKGILNKTSERQKCTSARPKTINYNNRILYVLELENFISFGLMSHTCFILAQSNQPELYSKYNSW